MPEPQNDNESAKVALLKERIQGHDRLESALQAQRFLGATVAHEGQTWKPGHTKASASKRPQKDKDPTLRIPLNLIFDKVQHQYGRLLITDFGGNFVTLEDERVGTESPEYAEKLDLIQDLFWRWLPQSRIREWADELNFRRVTFGWEVGRWRLPWTPALVKRYGGLILDRSLGARLVTDPTVVSQDPNDHRYLISIEAMPLAEVNATYERGVKAKERYPIQSGPKLGNLIASDNWLSKYVGRKVHGAYGSKTPGLVVCTMWDQWWEQMDVFLLNLEHVDPKTRRRTSREWLHVWPVGDSSNDWLYGCPWLKLDCYRNVRKWAGDSLVMKVAPMQAIANLMMRAKVRRTLFHSLVRVLVLTNALAEGGEDQLRSNRAFEIVGVKRGFPTEKIAQVLQFPRIDPGEDQLLSLAFDEATRLSGASEPLVGKASDRETATGYVTRVQQALVPYQPTAAQDQGRFTEWLRNASEASARFHGVSSPRKQCIVIFGKNHAELLSGKGTTNRIRKVLDSGKVKFKMHDEAFRPVAVDELKQQMVVALEAGRFGPLTDKENWRRFAIQWFLRTGEEYDKGESDRFHEANIVVGMAMRGKPVEIAYGDPVIWIVYLAKTYLGVSRGRKYTPEQRDSLRRLIAAARNVQDLEAQEEASIAMRRQMAAPGGGPGGPGGPSAPGPAAASSLAPAGVSSEAPVAAAG